VFFGFINTVRLHQMFQKLLQKRFCFAVKNIWSEIWLKKLLQKRFCISV